VRAIVGGTSLLSSSIFNEWKWKEVRTGYGDVAVRGSGDFVFLQRHGKALLPPHKINHRAHIQALRELGVIEIIGINSVGSLKMGIKPGTFVIPDDFLSPWDVPTFFDQEMRFVIPTMDSSLAARLGKACLESGLKALRGGTYIQTTGPRLETRAEIRMLKRFGDVIGMTMASEATLCAEYSIPYASLCSVDNYCNGIAKEPLTMDDIYSHAKRNAAKIESVIGLILTRGFL
jgi:purine nucleoside phosphorylase